MTHGAFLHYLTEDWTGDDPKRGEPTITMRRRETFVFEATYQDHRHCLFELRGAAVHVHTGV